ncbi:DUF4124 domain-containing protein [Sinimarinibacterium thermocellulolyticum]|uniref:DUF4124 domain-containing protein n=1 Tax=Sinimarinibacterium thermocellulolyticum TaxID=3170016 RepID=A0ABV2A8I0_9GAMM
MWPKTASVALLLLAAAGTAGAGPVYKWVDDQGRVHYADTPKPGWKRVDLKVAPGFAPATGGQVEGTDTQQGAAPDSPERGKLRAEECQKRREQLETYRRASTITERDALGNERTYNEEQRLQLIEQTQQQVRELCGADG